MATIQELKKGDRFKFNDQIYTVTRKFIDDDKPLKAYNETKLQQQDFHHEGLEVELLAATKDDPRDNPLIDDDSWIHDADMGDR